MAIFGVSLKDNPEQQELARLIMDNQTPIICCIGDAGTGKTFVSLATALELKEKHKYDKIIYARNPIQVGEEMGFLKGDIDDKYGPFMFPLWDNLEAICKVNKGERLNPRNLSAQIEMTPIAFLRGRSFDNAIVIVDEAQNLDLTALKTIATRIGKYCKLVLLGSMNQIDDRKQRMKEKCDFERVMEKLQELPYVGFVHLEKSMRSEICAEVDKKLNEIK